MNPKLSLLVNSVVCAICLAAFSMIPGFIKYIFSLTAFFLGLRFFGAHDSWKMKLALIGITIVLFFVFVILYTILAIAYGWYIPTVPEDM